ncbi:PTS sugar transporter subunit IIA [Fusibacter sp. JL216-2]|uniref:PTS sugar transporter subunit IIA n=1 Tax=Fusibacter sp. JL216-2 TaxID=3071453 RepID=UPI003D3583FB
MLKTLFTEDLMIGSLKANKKNKAIEEMVDQLDKQGKLLNKSAYLQAVLDREEEYSTGIGMGIAIPHGKSTGVKEPALVFARSEAGVDFDSMDGEPAHLIFMVAVPESANEDHLKILGLISRKLMHKDVRDQLMAAKSYDEVLKIIS